MGIAPFGAIIALGVPALLAAKVPKRWMAITIVLWTVSPAIAFLTLDLIGNAIDPSAQPPQSGRLAPALLLAGSFLLVPWILTCATGFGIGFAIRAQARKPRKPSPSLKEATPRQPTTPTIIYDATPVLISHPVQPVMDAVTADGVLRYQHRQGELINGRYDSVSLCAVLMDVETGRTLVDCAGWASSEISAQTDGSLFLYLQQNQFASLFRIDGRLGLFRDLANRGDDRPLSALAKAVETAWRATAQRRSPPQYRYISRDAAIRVDLASEEWSNSHWVNAPQVIEMATGRIVLDLWGTDWDAVVSFREVGRVRLDCRRYHLGGALSVVLDIARGAYQITLDPALGGMLPEESLDGVAAGLEVASQRVARGKA